MLGNLLITPSLKKAYSNNLLGLLDMGSEPPPRIETREPSNILQFHTSQVNTKSKLDKLNEKTNMLIDEQEAYKQSLFIKCSEKMASLDISKQQTRCSIEQLRHNLHDIELLTANNIFKITSIKNNYQ